MAAEPSDDPLFGKDFAPQTTQTAPSGGGGDESDVLFGKDFQQPIEKTGPSLKQQKEEMPEPTLEIGRAHV